MEVEDPSSGTTGLLLEQHRQSSTDSFVDGEGTQQDDDGQTSTLGQNRMRQEFVRSTAMLLAHLLAIATLFMVYRWIYMLGGLSWTKGKVKLVFNWHPLLMTTAFCFMTAASLSFRTPWISLSRTRRKVIHGLGWFVAAMTMMIALIAVFKSHNDKKSGYIANMYSFHSWLGACVLFVYVLQFLIGGYFFWLSKSPTLKAWVLQCHVVVGPLLYFAVSITILLGIQEKEGFVGCSYEVDEVNIFPEIRKIPDTCLVSHTLGLLVFLTMVCTFVALQRPDVSAIQGIRND
ncbi:hypothetical protein ACA910_016678 [Epithemia clementina (nom. ined.)]